MRCDNLKYCNEIEFSIARDKIIILSLILSFRIAIDSENQRKSYNEILRTSQGFKNPAIVENSFIESGLKPKSHYSLMSSKSKFPPDEYAKDLRQIQASKLAFR